MSYTTSNLFNDLDLYLGQIMSLYEAKYLCQIFSQTFCFIEEQYLAQLRLQIFEHIRCVDAGLAAKHLLGTEHEILLLLSSL